MLLPSRRHAHGDSAGNRKLHLPGSNLRLPRSPARPIPPRRPTPSALYSPAGMAAEARAESPAPEKRAAPADVGEEEEERPGPKRRRAFVATLDGVPCAAAAAAEDGHRGGLSFSFQHSRGGFVPPETTPKFGSFNPPAPAEQQEAPDPKPAPPAGEDSPVLEEEGEDPASPSGVGDRQDGNSESVEAAGDQGEPETQDEPECADVHHQ